MDEQMFICSTEECKNIAQMSCGRCNSRYYCSNACCIEDWNIFDHKTDCQRIYPKKKKRCYTMITEELDGVKQKLEQIGIPQYPPPSPIPSASSSKTTLKIPQSQPLLVNSKDSFECPACIKSVPSQDKLRKRKILALDGGGIKALVTLTVLQAIFDGKEEEFPVWKVFDMVAGTSTGSLLTSLLCTKRFTIQQCLEFYMNAPAFTKSKTPPSKTRSLSSVFSSGVSGKLSTALNQVFSFSSYDSKSLSSLLQNELKRTDGRLDGEFAKDSSNPDDKDSPNYIPYIVITALRVDISPTVVLYTNFTSGHTCSEARFTSNLQNRAFLWEAVLASSAAPTYFSPYSRSLEITKIFGGVENEFNRAVLVDGGVGNNNPAILAMEQASCVWNAEEVGFILSIGTGVSPPSENSGYTPFRNDPYRLESGSNLNAVRRLLASVAAFKSLLNNVILGYTLYGINASENTGSLLESFGINHLRIDPALKTIAPIAVNPSDKQGKIVMNRMIQETLQYLQTPAGKLQIKEAREYLFEH